MHHPRYNAEEIQVQKQNMREEQENERILDLAVTKKRETDHLKHKTDPESRRMRARSYTDAANIFANAGLYFNNHAVSDYESAINLINKIPEKQVRDVQLQIKCYLSIADCHEKNYIDRQTAIRDQNSAREQAIVLLLEIKPVNYMEIALIHEKLAHDYAYEAGLQNLESAKLKYYSKSIDHALKAAELGYKQLSFNSNKLATNMIHRIGATALLASEYDEFSLTEEQEEKIVILQNQIDQAQSNPSVALLQTVQGTQSAPVLTPSQNFNDNLDKNSSSSDEEEREKSFSEGNIGVVPKPS